MKPFYVCIHGDIAYSAKPENKCSTCDSEYRTSFFADDLLKEIEVRVKKYESFLLTPNELTSDGGIIGELQSLADKIKGA